MRRLVLIIIIMSCLIACRKNAVNYIRKPRKLDPVISIVPADTATVVMLPTDTTRAKADPLTCREVYEASYLELKAMLEGREPLNFKRAVFVTEDAYYMRRLSYEKFCSQIEYLKNISQVVLANSRPTGYKFRDSINFYKNGAIFSTLTDTVHLGKNIVRLPFEYDFDDYYGITDWSKMFVTKLLNTKSGNCHSLPYLYKILAEELDAKAYLSISPNHIYIKNFSLGNGWYNTELTSKTFPHDAWVTATGYITLDAIRSGIFMDTLSLKQSVAMCAFDLAKGYQRKTGKVRSSFIIRCCDLALEYYPTCVSAMLLKAETLKQQYEKNKSTEVYQQMETLYVTILNTGYRDMPEAVYDQWMKSIYTDKDKYLNRTIKRSTTLKRTEK